MILKYKDSKNNWNYVTLGNFKTNKLDISKNIEKALKPYTMEDIVNEKAHMDVINSLADYILKNTGIYANPPIIDWNIVHKLSNVIIVENETVSINYYVDKFPYDFSINQREEFKSNVYVISDECYLMDGNGKTIEKLM